MILRVKTKKIKVIGYSSAIKEAIIGSIMINHSQPLDFPCEVTVVDGRFGKSGDPIVKLPNGKTMSAKYLNYAN